jgi:CubicO group peptidase (beta-lactamase class C family)
MAGPPPFDGRGVTLANWQEPPFSRWAFQHIRELIPTARIDRGDGPEWRLPRADRDLSRIRFRAGGREMTVDQLLRRTWTDGFLVLHRGRIVAERYRNGLTPDTPHLVMSISKSIVSTIAGILAERGALDLSGLVTDVVPELGRTSFAGATVQQLLDMRTGTRFDETYEDPRADVRVYEQVYLWRPRSGRRLPADALGYFGTLRNDGEHGGPFRYRSILPDVLAWVLERAAGARLHELIARELWRPMGAEFDAEITVDARGNPMADGGICATLRDLARFGRLFVQGGRRGGRAIVPGRWIEDTIRGAPDGPRAFVEGDHPPGFRKGTHYRNNWWVEDPAAPSFSALGINGQHLFVHVPWQTVVVKLSTWPVALDPALRRATTGGMLAIADALASERV